VLELSLSLESIAATKAGAAAPVAITLNVGTTYTGSTAGATITINNVVAPAGGFVIIGIRSSQPVTAMSLGGTAGVQISSATTTGPKASMWGFVKAAGTYTLSITSTAASCGVGVVAINPTSTTPTATAFKDWNFSTAQTGTTLTCPANGIIITTAVYTTSITWDAPAVGDLNEATNTLAGWRNG
jgi:hypothetical protein